MRWRRLRLHFLSGMFQGFKDPQLVKPCREAVTGDPAQWARVLAGLEAVRQATRPRGARVVLVIVSQPGSPPGDLPEERLAALTRQAALDRRHAPLNLNHIPDTQPLSPKLPLTICCLHTQPLRDVSSCWSNQAKWSSFGPCWLRKHSSVHRGLMLQGFSGLTRHDMNV